MTERAVTLYYYYYVTLQRVKVFRKDYIDVRAPKPVRLFDFVSKVWKKKKIENRPPNKYSIRPSVSYDWYRKSPSRHTAAAVPFLVEIIIII